MITPAVVILALVQCYTHTLLINYHRRNFTETFWTLKYRNPHFLPRDAIQARPCHAVSVSLCVCVCVSDCLSVTSVDSFKMNKHMFKNFSPSGSRTILAFPHQTLWRYSYENPLTGTSNAGGVDRNRDSEPISGFTACCERCDQLAVMNRWESRFLAYSTCIRRPRGYPMVKKVWPYDYTFWQNVRTWQTDGRTDGHRMTA